MELVRRGAERSVTRYHHIFNDKVDTGFSFSFGCDITGQSLLNVRRECIGRIDLQTMELHSMVPGHDHLALNWEQATQSGEFIYQGIDEETNSWFDPDEWRCDCGAAIFLRSYDETCDRCGQAYNCFGQRIQLPSPDCHCGAYWDGRDCMCFES